MKTATETRPEEGKGRHLGKSSIWAEEDTSVEALETGSDKDVGKGRVRNACTSSETSSSSLAPSSASRTYRMALTTHKQFDNKKGEEKAPSPRSQKQLPAAIRFAFKRRRVVETRRQTKTDEKESRVLCWQSFKGHNGHLSRGLHPKEVGARRRKTSHGVRLKYSFSKERRPVLWSPYHDRSRLRSVVF